MTKRFMMGFVIVLLIFIAINLLSAHLRSDCGLPAVFGRDGCADDIARAGLAAPILRRWRFCLSSQLQFHLPVGQPGDWYCVGRFCRFVICTDPKNSIQIGCLCYNAVTMQNRFRFVNDNDNNNDDPPRIVGRSLAG